MMLEPDHGHLLEPRLPRSAYPMSARFKVTKQKSSEKLQECTDTMETQLPAESAHLGDLCVRQGVK